MDEFVCGDLKSKLSGVSAVIYFYDLLILFTLGFFLRSGLFGYANGTHQ